MHTLTYMLHLVERDTSVRETGRERKREKGREGGAVAEQGRRRSCSVLGDKKGGVGNRGKK